MLVILLAHVAWLWTIQEDAFIGFRYVKNLVAGHGFLGMETSTFGLLVVLAVARDLSDIYCATFDRIAAT